MITTTHSTHSLDMMDPLALAGLLISFESICSISKIYRYLVIKKITSSGGSRPNFCARFHLSNRLIPTQGPYFAVMSKTRRISVGKISDYEGTARARKISTGGQIWVSMGSQKEFRTYDVYHCVCRNLRGLILIRQALISLMPSWIWQYVLGSRFPIASLAAFNTWAHSLLFTFNCLGSPSSVLCSGSTLLSADFFSPMCVFLSFVFEPASSSMSISPRSSGSTFISEIVDVWRCNEGLDLLIAPECFRWDWKPRVGFGTIFH